jgi:hypothetical protein
MRRLVGWIRRHRFVTSAAGVVVVGLGVFVLLWFQPQKLFINKTVNEDLPPGLSVSAPPTPAQITEQAEQPPGHAQLSRSALFSRGHHTTGAVSIYRLADGRRILRFDDLRTSNGPDLRVRLSVQDAHAPNDTIDHGTIDLGGLKGNRGSQNYVIPASVDLTKYHAAIIWCRRFSYAFGAAVVEVH